MATRADSDRTSVAPAHRETVAQRRARLTRALGEHFTPGTGGTLRWFFSAIWLVYLVQPVSDLFGHRHGVLWIAGGLAITVAFCALYVPVLVNSDGRPRQALIGLGAIAALAALACVVYGKGWTPLWIYVSAAAGMVLPTRPGGRRLALRGVLAVGACYLFFSWLSHDNAGDFFAVLLPVLLIGVAMIGFRMQIQLVHELDQARETVAKLAANEERLRLARDMHDLTGQSLSMITLKSELAAKRLTRLPATEERDTVLGDLGDIGRVSRQTLHDIREAVSGYRRPTLAIEVITARNALDAAGIRLDDDPALTLRSGTFDADAEAVLAWCLREAVTNVIRHSGAKSCRIRLIEQAPIGQAPIGQAPIGRAPIGQAPIGQAPTEPAGELSLEVTDDGRGLPGPPPAGTGLTTGSAGSGLRGMSERLGTAGGRLSLGAADPGSGRGFKLTATVPVDHYDS
jgi:two-component system, NarL family, sensor histidine kinase DesK